jgi:hypothetical protein
MSEPQRNPKELQGRHEMKSRKPEFNQSDNLIAHYSKFNKNYRNKIGFVVCASN